MTTPEQRAAVITKRIDSKMLKTLAQRARTENSAASKIVWLRKLAAPLEQATKGVVPCHDGCSHCCNIPVMLTEEEARKISKETGVEMTLPQRFVRDAEEKYTGTPCPFLKESRCSIYASRPFACRVHYSMHTDESLCKIIPGTPVYAPYLDNRQYHMAYVTSMGLENMKFADIRDFFPDPA